MPTLTDADLKEIANKLNEAIDEYSIHTLRDKPRTHLGISEIGEPCSRALYYKFHWCNFQTYDSKHNEARMLRLFKRGHREEERFVNYLIGIGCEVQRFAQELWYSEELNDYKILEWDADKSGGVGSYRPVASEYHVNKAKSRGLILKQFRVSGAMGHYGGSCDGQAITPWIPDKFLLEFKTHNSKSFSDYLNKGLHKSKPKHLAQMSGYGYKMNIEYGIYFPENKNDDDIKIEVVRLDHKLGAELERKAEDIILAKELPPRISDNPAFFECKFCEFISQCHYSAAPLKNCRSCRMSLPTENATWTCSRYNQIIPVEFIEKGCNDWCPI